MADDAMQEVAVKLAVLDTKLDALTSMVMDRLNQMDKKVDDVEEDLRSKLKHDRSNTDQKFLAIERLLEGKVDKSVFEPIQKTFWAGVLGVLSALGTAVWALVAKGG